MKLIPYKQHNHIGYCVYFLYDKDEIVYIGYTFNLGKRLGEHSQWSNTREGYKTQLIKKQFTHYSIIPMNDVKKARKLESSLIKKHKPKYNKNNHYHWVSTGRKYIFYKPDRGFGMRETASKKNIYTLMAWKKSKTNRHWNYKNKYGVCKGTWKRNYTKKDFYTFIDNDGSTIEILKPRKLERI
jgi:predicted GIY-YIG superfamily endonuclease